MNVFLKIIAAIAAKCVKWLNIRLYAGGNNPFFIAAKLSLLPLNGRKYGEKSKKRRILSKIRAKNERKSQKNKRKTKENR